MHMCGRLVLCAALTAVLFTRAADAAPCDSLASLSLPHATISVAQTVAAGEFAPPAGRGRGNFGELPAFCRVAATLTPSSDSEIKMEVWLPISDWNGKFEASSAAGWAGAINYGAMREAMKRGYAVASNDSGHTGGSGAFALGHPEKVVDFAWRAEHEMTLHAKALIARFYGSGPRYSYWEGCSTAGRMALTEAQRFPSDFDGIVAGAPANFTSHQIVQQALVAQASHKSDTSLIPPSKFATIHRAVLDACDALDGVKDGLVSDPQQCTFDPKVLQCAGEDGPACLTAEQVDTARAIYRGATTGANGHAIFPGLSRGSELGWATLAGQQPQAFSREMWQNIVVKDTNWDYKTMNIESDVAAAEKAYGGTLDALNADLRPFFGRGGKLIQYHGWSDPAIAPQNSVNYYESVVKKVGTKAVADSYRLFMVPGMAHCGGGEGTSTFDMLTPLEQWVEQRKAPAQISASRTVNGAINRTRALCPFPQIARYTGTGSIDDAMNFECKVP
jgi:feruloyl esterase